MYMIMMIGYNIRCITVNINMYNANDKIYKCPMSQIHTIFVVIQMIS